VILGFLLVK